MDKQIKNTNNSGKVINATIYPKVEGYDELTKKCDELSVKWGEIKQLVNEIENIKLPIEFYQAL